MSKAKNLHRCLLAFETASLNKVSKKRQIAGDEVEAKKAVVEAEVQQLLEELDAREARASE